MLVNAQFRYMSSQNSSLKPMPLRQILSVATLISAGYLLAACGPSDIGSERLKSVKTGSTRADVLQAIGDGPLVAQHSSDSVRVVNGYLRQEYGVGGTLVEVIWYRESPGNLDDALVRETMTPIMLEHDTVTAKGWKPFKKRADAIGVPRPVM